MNRFYMPGEENWSVRPFIGPAVSESDQRRKMIPSWIFGDGGGEKSGIVRDARHSYNAALAVVDGLRAKRGEIEGTRRFTPLGISQEVGEVALTDALPALRRAKAVLERAAAKIENRASKITLAKPTTDEARREQEEIRAAVRGMDAKQRDQFLKENREDPNIMSALASGIPALSGLPPLTHSNIKQEQIKREHGKLIEELSDLAEVVDTAGKVVTAARDELREVVGCTPAVFEQIAKVAEANGGELPFRIETQIVDNKVVDFAKVFDFQAKRWRDARPEEIAATHGKQPTAEPSVPDVTVVLVPEPNQENENGNETAAA